MTYASQFVAIIILTIARTAAFIPGASPPLVITAIFRFLEKATPVESGSCIFSFLLSKKKQFSETDEKSADFSVKVIKFPKGSLVVTSNGDISLGNNSY
ncbi:unnamed protein product [Pneumocystis jirovecii]|uniref:Uncharacterized protein n=1 Tax=Pneumocystis jirovecii TaxID=42068 RepID=L0PFZ4_PNEJI|nr:unnamed protein product [Pneumocystis jirovecii]